MAFPFKTGGDFYNCEALRMRLHNLGANPTETATGLMYFNTGASNLGKHAVVHDGTNFKALAFVDEIATNTAFTELADRVVTIEKALGEDTANVIDTWEEIQNFLKDINANDANLMTMLNSKLDKSGGTIEGTNTSPLIINTSATTEVGLRFNMNEKSVAWVGYTPNTGMYLYSYGTGSGTHKLGLSDAGVGFLDSNTLLHSGNYATEIGDYYLKSSGGTIEGGSDALKIKRAGSYLSSIGFYNSDSKLGSLGFVWGNAPAFFHTDGNYYLLLHSGNIGDYALKTDGSNLMSGDNGLRWSNDLDFDLLRMGLRTYMSSNGTSVDGVFPSTNYGTVLHVGNNVPKYAFQLASPINADGLFYRGYFTSANKWLDWKQIAFTDSNVASATKLQAARTIWGQSFDGTGNVDGALYMGGRDVLSKKPVALYIGYESASDDSLPTYLWGKGIHFINSGGQSRMLVTDEGNVFIGTSNELKSGAKLQIKGDVYVDGNIIATKEVSAGGAGQEGESGDGGAEVIDKELAKGQSSYTIPNTIGRSAVAVSLYEWNANNSSWDMCLADISVKDTTITVTFGSATSVNHKLVAVG